jgi:hypothetical protein
MKKVIFILLGFIFFNSNAQDEVVNNNTISKKFTFRAGKGTSVNFFKQQADQISYKKVSMGNGLGTELSYNIKKRWMVNANYYWYAHRNKINTSEPLLAPQFVLNQQNHFLAVTFSYKILAMETRQLFISTGPGFSLNNEQTLKIDKNTDAAIGLSENRSIRYFQPVAISFENYIKRKVILGTCIQTFIHGSKRPFNGFNLFSYLAFPF